MLGSFHGIARPQGPRMLHSFHGIALRGMRTHKLRSALTGLGVTLGVGMVFGVLVLVGTIHSTFTQLIDSAYGTRSLIITPRGGGTLPGRTVSIVRSTPGVKSTGQSIGGTFIRLDAHGKPIHGNAGLMWVAGFNMNESPYDFGQLAGRGTRSGPEVVLEQNWARTHHLHIGQYVAAATPTGRVRLHVVGVFGFSGGVGFGGQGLAGVPLAYARRVMNQPTDWMDIAVTTTDKGKAAVADVERRLQRELGPGVQVQAPSGLEKQATAQLKALNVVLYFFSGVALFVGAFLILNSFNMTVLQRMREIGTLRTLGATRRMIVSSILTEALAIGVAGTLVGLGLGFLLAKGLISAMKGFGIPIGGISVGASAAITAVVLGLLVTVLGALRPARRAGKIAPIRAVLGDAETRARPRLSRAIVGLALFLPGCLLGGRFWMGGGNSGATVSAILGIGMTMALFAGIVIAAPFLIMPVLRLLAAPLRRVSPSGGRLAFDSASGNPLRTAATAAALTVGLSVFVVNSVFSASFLGTIREQVDRSFAHDFTVQSIGGGLETGDSFQLSPSVAGEVRKLPAAQVVSSLRTRFVELPQTHAEANNGLAIALDPSTYGKVDRSEYRGASSATALAGLAHGGIIAGPAFASAAGIHVGSVVTLRGTSGTVRAPVVAELASLAAMGGMVMEMSQATQQAVYGPLNDTQLLVKAKPGQAKTLQAQTQALLDRRYPNLELQSSVGMKRHVEKQVNQQFGLFNAIIFVAVIVSLLGVINTLAMSVIERTREIGVLRALGSSRWQVRKSLLNESLLITLAGAIVGVLMGLVVGAAWIAGLGDLMPGISFRFPVGATLTVAAIAIVLGTLAAVLPARRAARVDVIRALTYE
jgi:putative ABC transport system permease protein